MQLHQLSSDVLILVMQYLDARELAVLSQACSYTHALVEEFGWRSYLRLHSRPSYSTRESLKLWNPRIQARYHVIADRNWARTHFIARPLSCKWSGKLQPVLAINSSRLFVAAGNVIYSYVFKRTQGQDHTGSPGIEFECPYITSERLQAKRDITSMVSVPDEGLDRTIYLGFADGALERVELPPSKPGIKYIPIDPGSRDRHYYHGASLIESISSAGQNLLSLSAGGTAAFISRTCSTPFPQLVELQTRGWAAYLSAQASAPYAAFGTSSLTPLTIHPIRSTDLCHTASAILAASQSESPNHSSAVYGISGAPPSSPWGSSDQILVSGWYDGMVRVHDLRASTRSHSVGTPGPAHLLPVLSLCDPWLDEPIYAVSCGGGNSSHIAAGTARHSVVAFWDVRASNRGWSVHAPGNDSSPVYDVVMESSRLFGATQSRPFVLDFGPDVNEAAYPILSHNLREEGLKKRDKSGVGFYVTKYSHGRTGE